MVKSNTWSGQRWSVAHEWAAGALSVYRDELFIPGAPPLGPRIMGVLPMPETLEEAQGLIDRAHGALLVQRAALSTSRWCWVRPQPWRLLTAGKSGSGPQMVFLAYSPSNGSLLAQSLGMGLPEPLLGLVALVPTYVMQFEVVTNGRRVVADVHQFGGVEFPFEEPEGVAAVCAYGRSRDGESGMLAAPALTGPGRSWRVGDEFADLEASALARTGLPPASAGGYANVDVVLQSMIDPAGLDWAVPLEFEVSRFSLSALLGRMVWQVAYAVMVGAVTTDELAVMRDKRFGADVLAVGWQGLLDDQRGDRAVFADLLTDDEASFLPLSFVPELVDSRTQRQSEGRALFELSAGKARVAGRGVLADEVAGLVEEVFAAHPHWVEER